MNWKRIKWNIRYAWQYVPFTFNTVLCAAAGWAAYKILYKPTPKGEEPSAVMPFIALMGKIVFWFVTGVVGLSVLSTFIVFLYYLWLKKRNEGQQARRDIHN
jgi:hypothetical protein